MGDYEKLREKTLKNDYEVIEIDESDVEEIVYPFLKYMEIKFKIAGYNPMTKKYLCVEVKEDGNDE